MFLSTVFISSLKICMGGLIGSCSSWECRKFVAASTPSWCGILVYSEETSMLIKIADVIKGIFYSPFMIGCSQKSTNLEIFLMLDTTGLIPIGFL